MTFQDKTIFRFPEAYHAKRGVDGAPTGMWNPHGEEIMLVRDVRHDLLSITSPHPPDQVQL